MRESILLFLSIFAVVMANNREMNKEADKKETNDRGTAKKTSPAPAPKKEIFLDSTQFAVFDRDLNEPKEYAQLKVGEAPTTYEINPKKKIKMQFVVKDKNSKAPMPVHQSFIAFVHEESQREVIYVAEPDKTSHLYTFDLDLKTSGKDFNGLSGKYSMSLMLGDAQISNSMNWNFANIVLTVPEALTAESIPKSSIMNYTPMEEISHMFKEQEARPPVTVSDAFTALCLSPLLLLVVLWLKVGINFGNMKCSPWALGFHVGLGAIFGLYICYWVHLNMFQTLKLLIVVSIPTIVFGNRLLRSFVDGTNPKKQKPE